MTRQQQIDQFLNLSGYAGAEQVALKGDASFRRYIRVLHNGNSYILMDAPPDKEPVAPYLTVAEYLRGQGYSAPIVLVKDESAGLLLLEDLGNALFTALLTQKTAVCEETLYSAAIDVLVDWHTGKFAQSTLALPPYDQALLMQEVCLFADWYLPAAIGAEAAAAERNAFLSVWQAILAATPGATGCFVHRDYHVDNLLWLPERSGHARVGLLDFQDATLGDAAYDVVSLLQDARRDVPEALEQAMIARFLHATATSEEDFMTRYAVLGAQRNCKIIGIFVRLAVRDGKPGYLKHLPRVWHYVQRDMQHPALQALRQWCDATIAPEMRGELQLPGIAA